MSKINPTLSSGTLYIKGKDEQEWTAIGKVKEAIIGLDPELHKKIKNICRFFAYGYDSYTDLIEETCRHPRNTPRGSSWGICDSMSCPLAVDLSIEDCIETPNYPQTQK